MVGTRYKKKAKTDVGDWFLAHWQHIILLIFLCAGVAVGAAVVRESQMGNTGLSAYFSGFLAERQGANFAARFLSAFSGCLVFYLGTLLLALSMPGAVILPFLTLFRGMGVGLLMAYFYRFLGAQGMVYAILILLPHLLIVTGILLSASGLSMRLSLNISKKLLAKNSSETPDVPDFRRFFIRQGRCLLFLCLSALLDSCLGLCFDRFFNF